MIFKIVEAEWPLFGVWIYAEMGPFRVTKCRFTREEWENQGGE